MRVKIPFLFGIVLVIMTGSAWAEPMLIPLEPNISQGQKVYVPLIGGPKSGQVAWSCSENLKLISSSRKGAKVQGVAEGKGSVTARFGAHKVETSITIAPLADAHPRKPKPSKKASKDSEPKDSNKSVKSSSPDPVLENLLKTYRSRLKQMNLEDRFARKDRSAEKNPPVVQGHEAALQQLSEDFLRDLGAKGKSLKDLQRFRDRYMAASSGGDPLFPGEKGWDAEFLPVERALMFGRAVLFDKLLKDTIRETLQKNPDACLIGQIDIGSWVKLDLAGLTFPGDIDASTVAVDPSLNIRTRELLEGKFKNLVGLNMVEADTVLTAHGQATGDVFIGHWGKAYAELDMLDRSSWKQIVPVLENGEVVDIKMVKRRGKDLFWEVALRAHEEAVKQGRERGPEVEFPKLDLTKEPMLSMEMLRHGIHDVEHGPYSRGQQVIKMLKYAQRSYFMNKKAVAEYGWNPYQQNDPALAKLATEVAANKKDPAKVSQLISDFSSRIPEFAGRPITADNVDALTGTILARAKTAMHDNATRALAFRLHKLAGIEDEVKRTGELDRLWNDLDTEIREFRKSSSDAPRAMVQALDLVQSVKDGTLRPHVLEQRSQALHKLLSDSYKLPEPTIARILIFDSYQKLRVYFRKKVGWMPDKINAFITKAKQKYVDGNKVYEAVKEFDQKMADTTQGSLLLKSADWVDNAFNVYDAYLSGTDQVDAMKKSCMAIAEVALMEKFPALQIPLAAYRSVSQGDPTPLAMAVGFRLFPTVGQVYMASQLLKRADSWIFDAEFYDKLNVMLSIAEFNSEGKITAFKTKRLTEDVNPPGDRREIIRIFSSSDSPLYTSPAFRYWWTMIPTDNDQYGVYDKKLEKLRRVFPTHQHLRNITLLLQSERQKTLEATDKHYHLKVKQIRRWEKQIAELVWTAMADSLEAAVVATTARSEWEEELKRLESKLDAGDADLGYKKGLRAKAAFEVSKHGSFFTGENQYVIAPIYKKYISSYQAIEKIRLAITYRLWSQQFGVETYTDAPPVKRYVLTGDQNAAPRLTGDPEFDLAATKAAFKGHQNFAMRIKRDLSKALGRELDDEKDKKHLEILGQLGFEMVHLRDDCPERVSSNCTPEVLDALNKRFSKYQAYLRSLGSVTVEIIGADQTAAEEAVELALKLEAAAGEELIDELAFHWTTSAEAQVSGRGAKAVFSAKKPGTYAVVLSVTHIGKPGTPQVAEANHRITVAAADSDDKEDEKGEEEEETSDSSLAEQAAEAVGAASGSVVDRSAAKGGLEASPAEPKKGTGAGAIPGVGGLIDTIIEMNKKAAEKSGRPGVDGDMEAAKTAAGEADIEESEAQGSLETSDVQGIGRDSVIPQTRQEKADINAPKSIKSGDVFTVSLKRAKEPGAKYFYWMGPHADPSLRDKDAHPLTVAMMADPREVFDDHVSIALKEYDASKQFIGETFIKIPLQRSNLDTQIPQGWTRKSSADGFFAMRMTHPDKNVSVNGAVELRWADRYEEDISKHSESFSAAGYQGVATTEIDKPGNLGTCWGDCEMASKVVKGFVGKHNPGLMVVVGAWASCKLSKKTPEEKSEKKALAKKIAGELFREALAIAQSARLVADGAAPPPLSYDSADHDASPESDEGVPEETPTPTPAPAEPLGEFHIAGVPAKPVFGTKASIKLTSDKKISSSAAAVWSASQPGVEFNPPEGNSTTVTFGRMGPIKLWAQVLDKEDKKTIAETDQAAATVVAPSFSIQFDNAAPLVGQEVKATIVSNPALPADLAGWYWMSPPSSNRMEYNDQGSVIGFTLKDTSALSLQAEARVRHYSDIIGTATANIQAKSYRIEVKAKKRGLPVMVWDPNVKGLVRAKASTYYTGEQLGLRAELEGAPKPSTVRWKWTVNEGVTISNTASQTPTVSRSEAGSIVAKVTAFNKDKIVLATGDISLSVMEPPKEPKTDKAGGSSSSASSKAAPTKSDPTPTTPPAPVPTPDAEPFQGEPETDESSVGTQKAKQADIPSPEIDNTTVDPEREKAMGLIKSGREKEKANDLEGALSDYKDAQKVLNNPRLAGRIAELEKQIAKKQSAMGLVKSGREKEKRGDLHGALADYQSAHTLLNNDRLKTKIRELKRQIAAKTSAGKHDGSSSAVSGSDRRKTKTSAKSGPKKPKWKSVPGARVSGNTKQVVSLSRLAIRNADGIMLYISEASEMTAQGKKDGARVGEVEFYMPGGRRVFPSHVYSDSDYGNGYSAKQAADGTREYRYMTQGAQGWASSPKKAGEAAWLDFRFGTAVSIDKIVVNSAPSRPYQLSSFEIRAFAWRTEQLSVGSGASVSSVDPSSQAPGSPKAKAVKKKTTKTSVSKVKKKKKAAKAPRRKHKPLGGPWSGLFSAQENDGHTKTDIVIRLTQNGKQLKGKIRVRIKVQGKIFSDDTVPTSGTCSKREGRLKFMGENVKVSLSADGRTMTLFPPDNSGKIIFKRLKERAALPSIKNYAAGFAAVHRAG